MSQFVPKTQDGKTARATHPGEALRANLKAYQDGELPAWTRLRIRWHLTHCAACREELTWLRRLGEDMQDLERATPGPHLRARILASLPDAPPVRAAGLEMAAPVRVTFARPAYGSAARLRLAGASALGLLLLGGAFALPRLSAFTGAKPSAHNNMAATTPTHSATSGQTNRRFASLTARSSSAQRQTSAMPSVVIPTSDETNDAATHLASLREQAEATREQRGRRLAWNHAVAMARATPSAHAPALPVAVVLQGDSLAGVQQQLQAWTRTSGGTLTIASAANTESRENIGSDSNRQLVINVPANRAANLPAVLTKLGAWELAAVKPSPGISGAVPAASLQDTPAMMRAMRPMIQTEADTAFAQRPSGKLTPNSTLSGLDAQRIAESAKPQISNTEHRTPAGWVRILVQVQELHGLNR